MAGAALTTPLAVKNPRDILGAFVIKTSEVLNIGDLVGIDSSGLAVCAQKTSTAVYARGVVAYFADNNGIRTGPQTTATGDGTVRAVIARRAEVTGFTGLTLGSRVYLDVAPTGGADNYTQTQPTGVANDAYQVVGYPSSTTAIDVQCDATVIGYQASGNSTAKIL